MITSIINNKLLFGSVKQKKPKTIKFIKTVARKNEKIKKLDRAVVVLPGLGNSDLDYKDFSKNLSEYGLTVGICPVKRIDWLRNASGLRDMNYWRGTLHPRPTVDWFLSKLDATVNSIKKETKDVPITLLAHSAGGWLARIYMKDFGFKGIDQLITLGSPHLPPPSDAKNVIDQTRGILTYCDNEIPGAFHPEVNYVTVSGKYIKGSKFSGNGSLSEKLVGFGYKQVCGDAEVWGDGITPVPSAHLPGSKKIELENVYHTPVGTNNKEKNGRYWYGSKNILKKWISEIID